jgi:hypothetical protein
MTKRRRLSWEEEAHEAVMRRIKQMTPEDWLRSIEELSRAPEGVEDPWPPYNGALPQDAPDTPCETMPVPPREKR